MASFTKLCKAIKDMVSHKAKGHWEWDTGSEHIQGTQEVGGNLELVAYFKAAKGGIVVDVEIEQDGDMVVEHQQAFQTEDPDAIAKYILQQISYGEKHHKKASDDRDLKETIKALKDRDMAEMLMGEKPDWHNDKGHAPSVGKIYHRKVNGKNEFLKVTKIFGNGWLAKFDVLNPTTTETGATVPNEHDIKHKDLLGQFVQESNFIGLHERDASYPTAQPYYNATRGIRKRLASHIPNGWYR